MNYNELLNDMKKRLETFEKIPYGQAIGAPWPYSDVGGMVWNDPEPYFFERSINAITDLLSRAEAAEAAQETLQKAMAEYKARAEKAEKERDAYRNMLYKERPCSLCVSYKNTWTSECIRCDSSTKTYRPQFRLREEKEE